MRLTRRDLLYAYGCKRNDSFGENEVRVTVRTAEGSHDMDAALRALERGYYSYRFEPEPPELTGSRGAYFGFRQSIAAANSIHRRSTFKLECAIFVLPLFFFVDFLAKECQLEDGPRDCVPQHQKAARSLLFSLSLLITTYLALRPCLNRVQDKFIHGIENAVELYKETFHRGGFEVALVRDRTGWPDYVSFLPVPVEEKGIRKDDNIKSPLLPIIHLSDETSVVRAENDVVVSDDGTCTTVPTTRYLSLEAHSSENDPSPAFWEYLQRQRDNAAQRSSNLSETLK